MILYLDTSALLKLYVLEPGSSLVRQCTDTAALIVTHLLTYTEMRAGLAKAHRMGRVDARELATKKTEIERDWLEMDILLPNEPMIRRAGDLAEGFGLRGYDSIHLAAAEQIASHSTLMLTFACFDTQLNDAANALGLRTLISSPH